MINQQRMLNNLWQRKMQNLRSDDVRIIGKVVGKVSIKDLNIEIENNKEMIISLADYNRSKDLRNAINKNWIEVLDKFNLPNRYETKNIEKNIEIIETKNNIDKEVAKEIAKEMAKEMAKELLKENESVKETAKELAKEMINEFLKQLPKQNYVDQNNFEEKNQKQIKAVEIESETFVNMKEKVEFDNILDLSGTINSKSIESKNVNKTLEKMKNLKKMKQNGGN